MRPGVWLICRKFGGPIFAAALMLVAWQAAVERELVPPFVIPAPSRIILAIVNNWPLLSTSTLFTLYEALAGLVIGFGSGLLGAVVFLRSQLLRTALLPYALVTNAVPIAVFAPIAIVYFGFGAASKIALVAILVFFPALLSTFKGLSSIDPMLVEMMDSLAAKRHQIFLMLRLPNALPYVMTSLRISVTLSLIGAIVGEFFGSAKGLGFVLTTQLQVLHMDVAWASMAISAFLGIAGYVAVILLERVVLFWSPEFRRPV